VIERAIAALRAGEPVVLPTDTVYGLAADARNEAAVRALYRLKGREESQPTAIVAAEVEALVAAVPELRDRPILTGPYTLIVPNPERRFPWLTGERPETIGVRVPDLPPPAQEVVRRVGVVVATSANLPGGRDPGTVEEIPEELRAGAAAVVDAGELDGRPSTVIDLTGLEPVVVREGAVPAAEALARLV
jgi:L-threonylcarbamoyladenylate synthase